MKLRKVINEKCKECIHDPMDKGSKAQQVACCTINNCPLHPVRPITCKSIPRSLISYWNLTEADLCDRARPLIETSTPCPVEVQIDFLQITSTETNTNESVEGV